MEREERTDRFTALEDRFAGYEVYDQNGEKIGKVDDLFVDEADHPEYVGVKMGFLGTSSTLLPWGAVNNVDDEGQRIEVSVDKQRAKDGPTFDDDQDITPELENEVYSHYGLQRESAEQTPGTYGAYYSETTDEEQSADLAAGEHLQTVAAPTTSAAIGAPDEDDLRVERTEEELRAGTREREAGQLRVRKRVRTDREQVEVPTRREEVTVDRVPLEGEATSEAEIGEEEIEVPLTEEEAVVEKRPVAKEEVRIRKDVVEDTEVVEEDVRREEVEVDDETGRGTP